ncbi:hypothetical protein OG909_31480 [Streptomyces sp. NBC_01754]|uniref:hypothetical protein n=1 Tax=Streptomyces sp. NBC_01754 TaxID=2975930 RepID=UPI002DDB9E28|nr:hypothetical protein [Streptomyces sp. NBC_01754]WSC96468.1 hypothetical protein OG909_31480 [Streptomyces sp. NBC_01754]
MSFPPLGRHSGAAHHEYCNSALCCRCQQRQWSTRQGDERLCGHCASCCRECGRAPAPHLDGFDDGLCGECRGRCGRCGKLSPAEGPCSCRRWKERAGRDPVGYVLQALPRPLLQALGHRAPRSVPDLVHQELGRRTADQLLERVERRWNVRWSHALHEKDEDGRRRWAPEEIAEALVGPGRCTEPQCEDGYLISTGTPCRHCMRPTHRFVPATADRTAASDHARASAARIRRALLEGRSTKPGTPRPPR